MLRALLRILRRVRDIIFLDIKHSDDLFFVKRKESTRVENEGSFDVHSGEF